jgi:hypothetical protein
MFNTKLLLVLLAVIASGCKKQDTFKLPLENDPFFLGSQRTVIRPADKPWVIHYFPNESQDAVISRIENSAFFKDHKFRHVVRLRNGTYSASLPTKDVGSQRTPRSISAIIIYSGQLTSELKAIEGSTGATVHLIPLVRNEN